MMKYYSGLIDEGAWRTASGDLAVFSTKYRRNLKSLIVQLEPIQEGSGDPSPDNVRPISGRTGATVWRTGKNLFYLGYAAAEFTQNGITVTPNPDGSISASGTNDGSDYTNIQTDFGRWGNTPIALPQQSEDYTITMSYVMDGTWSANPTVYCGYIKSDDSAVQFDINQSLKYRTITVPKDAKRIRTWIRIPAGATVNGTIYIQAEYGSTATPYVPYTGTTYPVSWEAEAGTVYGGELDVVSGVLTVTDIGYVFTGLEGWTKYETAGKQTFNISVLSDNLNSDGIGLMSRYKFYKSPYISAQPQKSFCFFATPQLSICDNDYTDAATFAASMAGSMLVYPLATPLTYQLTPQQIQTLYGDNTVWSDAGPVDVEYWG